MQWEDARNLCQSYGGDLIVINSLEEWEFIKGTASDLQSKPNKNYDQFFIGLTDEEQEGTFKWIDGSALNLSLKQWADTEPDNGGKSRDDGHKEECTLLSVDLNWADVACESDRGYICEVPGT